MKSQHQLQWPSMLRRRIKRTVTPEKGQVARLEVLGANVGTTSKAAQAANTSTTVGAKSSAPISKSNPQVKARWEVGTRLLLTSRRTLPTRSGLAPQYLNKVTHHLSQSSSAQLRKPLLPQLLTMETTQQSGRPPRNKMQLITPRRT